MSIILDALRKSEAARRRNQAPDLFADMHDRALAPRALTGGSIRSAWAIAGISALGVGALAFAFWLATRTAPSATETTDAAVATKDPQAVDTESVGSEGVGSEAVASEVVDIGADRSGDVETPSEAPAPAPPPIPQPPTQADRPAAAPTVAPAIAPVPATMPAAPTSPPAAAPIVPSPAASSLATPRVAAPAPPPGEGTSPAFRSPGNDTPMSLGDLDAETRKQLPPLKLSMHMWHDVPAQRFVILDGRRLREGDVIDDVVVQRITREGATLSWRGTALKVEWR